jgi:hypothetical protein
MRDKQSGADQRRDKLLLRLLKTPPELRAETSERVRRAKRRRRKVSAYAKETLSNPT